LVPQATACSCRSRARLRCCVIRTAVKHPLPAQQ
jgi:hypothetical protein